MVTEKEIMIQIPDPNMRQFSNQGPYFIDAIPKELLLLELRIDCLCMRNLELEIYQDLKYYMRTLKKLALDKGLQIRTFHDFVSGEFVYTFEKGESPPLAVPDVVLKPTIDKSGTASNQ